MSWPVGGDAVKLFTVSQPPFKTTTTTMYFVDFEHLLSKTLSRLEFTLAIKGLRNNLTRSQVHSWQRTSNLFMASRMDTIYE